jgi:hypothetical protein
MIVISRPIIRVMNQAVIRETLTVMLELSQRGTCVGQSGNGTVRFMSYAFSLSTNAPYFFS